ncbi:hypothetical protein [Vibrio phage vB_pir03]|nr:hypothetical protein [Vibrio phage vB_pir03]
MVVYKIGYNLLKLFSGLMVTGFVHSSSKLTS